VTPSVESDARNIHRMVVATNRANNTKNNTINNGIVQLTNDGRPSALLHVGHHFDNCPLNRYSRTSKNVPMDEMVQKVKDQELRRPLVCKY
jgi:hypothetical protein